MDNYDSYCGIYCGACDIMMTYKTGKKHKLASFWNEAAVKKLQKKIGINQDKEKPFSYECHGCKSDILFTNCAACQIRHCAKKSKIEHCVDCQKYPCDLITGMKKLESLLPHLKANHTNMEAIKQSGLAQWFTDQESKWQCPKCQNYFSWYTSTCNNCGQDLKQYSFNFSFLKAALFKLLIYILPIRPKS